MIFNGEGEGGFSLVLPDLLCGAAGRKQSDNGSATVRIRVLLSDRYLPILN
jgi:hypothetical protein